jgi:division protein CdvB (Snf7/Vps24/ESCRT-III family)
MQVEHDDPKDMDKVKWRIEMAMDDAKDSVDHYAEKMKRQVDKRFDKLYDDIK